MVARCGLAGIATIDGRCYGGSISYRNGDVVSARFLAQDPAYDLYRPGFLCAYLMCASCADHDDIRHLTLDGGKRPIKHASEDSHAHSATW
nr:GNAT family N-acetyltransferase [Duganella lactea]